MQITTDVKSGIKRHRAYGLKPIIVELRNADIDPRPLLEGAGIPAEALDNPDYTLSSTEELDFVASALEALDDPCLGLRLGPRYQLSYYGMLGLAAMTSANLAETFHLIFKYIHMTWTYMHWTLHTEGDSAVMHLEKQRDLGECYQYMIDRGLSASYTIACDALGRALPLIEVNVMQPRPHYHQCYEDLFQCPVNFGAPNNNFRFEKSFLYEPLQKAESESMRIFETQCEQICASLDEGGGYAEMIRQQLLQLPNQMASLECIAERLHTTPRTIQRRLSAENTNYQELVESVRRNLAIEYLKTTELNLEEIAVRLGYADAPAFSHAFKRWTGTSPGAMRA